MRVTNNVLADVLKLLNKEQEEYNSTMVIRTYKKRKVSGHFNFYYKYIYIFVVCIH